MNVSGIDVAALSQALDDYDPDREHYLDLAKGSIWTFVFSESTDETRRKHEEIRRAPEEAHRRVPSLTTQEAYEEIEDFIENLENEAVQEALFTALEKKRAFRSFREAILKHSEERQLWMVYRKECSRRRVERFLATLEPDPVREGPAGAP